MGIFYMAFHVMVRKVLMEGAFKWVSRTPCRQRDSKANQKCGISDMSHKFPLITRQKHGVRETHLKPLPYAVSDMQLSHIVANQTICKIREVSNLVRVLVCSHLWTAFIRRMRPKTPKLLQEIIKPLF